MQLKKTDVCAAVLMCSAVFLAATRLSLTGTGVSGLQMIQGGITNRRKMMTMIKNQIQNLGFMVMRKLKKLNPMAAGGRFMTLKSNLIQQQQLLQRQQRHRHRHLLHPQQQQQQQPIREMGGKLMSLDHENFQVMIKKLLIMIIWNFIKKIYPSSLIVCRLILTVLFTTVLIIPNAIKKQPMKFDYYYYYYYYYDFKKTIKSIIFQNILLINSS
ncbi:hypothetical protein Phum_PHUM614590 [Pediculus humanus corporis]|uniref:Uncharacterized protein n=1 Tax=Pediculus humanus subsp. corporis TaxID=121224 RepID=E0W431_PEDHC|nr:uncharacterized protein Phum_PHUM614590 [Pediculus humanus corporis]EEB20387.1 hypothetical protein Phum_PHUM614590 [Pediculus humanus corporis]